MADLFSGIRTSARRLGWGVADQAVSSLSNFFVGAYVAKTLGAGGLGAFAIAFLTYSLIMNGSRGLATDPLMVRYSGAPMQTWRPAASAATGVALTAGLLAGAASLGAGLVLHASGSPELGGAFIALGVGLPGLILQDSWRYAFFSSGRGHLAFLNNTVWTVLLIGGLLLLGTGDISVSRVLLLFGGTATIAAAFGMLQSGLRPTPQRCRAWLSEHRSLGLRYLTENIIMGASGHFRSFVLAAAAGLVAVGELRAAEMLIGPFLVIFMGIAQVAVPEGRRWLERGYVPFRRFCLWLGVGLSAGALGYGVIIMLLLPLGLGAFVLGPVWQPAFALAPGVIVSAMAGSLMVGASAGLRAMGQARRSLRAQIVVTVITMTAGGVGAAAAGAMGAVWGGAIAAVIGTGVWWTSLLKGADEHFAAQRNGQGPSDTERGEGSGPHPEVVIATLMRETGGTGVQTHVASVVRYLQSVGVPVSLVTPFSSRSPLLKPVFAARYAIAWLSPAAGVWWYRHWHAFFLKRALRAHLARSPDAVVYAQCPVSADVALQVRDTQRVVMIVHFNVSQADEWADKNLIPRGGRLFAAIRTFEESVLPRLDGIVSVSAFMQSELQRRIPELAGVDLRVVPNFVDPHEPIAREPLADLITVGSLEPRKNQRYLLEVLAAAVRRGHRFTLTIVGDGPDRRELEDCVESLGIADQVDFIGYQDNARELMGGHLLYCHVARMEAFGIVLLEAMAEGIPVVATPVGGAVEIIRPGVDGVFWPLDDPEAAADVLVDVMADPARLRSMGESGRARLVQDYAADVVGHRLLDALSPSAKPVAPHG